MIRCQLIRVQRNRRGQAVRESQWISAEPLRIGRGADCQIHLPDPRVNLQHARLLRGSDGLYLEAERPLLYVNDRFEVRVRLQPGLDVGIGPYRISVEPAGDGEDVSLALELVSPLPEDGSGLRARSRTSLAAAGLSRRRLALLLGGAVLLLFVLLPLLPGQSPALRELSQQLPVGLDQSWDVGPVSPAHAAIARDCQSCHAQAFVQARDRECRACHEDVADHASTPDMQAVAFDGQRCASCHLEHKGPGLAERNPSLCVDCHADPAAPGIAGVLPAIADFASAHPPFRVSHFAAANVDAPSRQAATPQQPLREANGLRFPHDVHLDADGIASPQGRRQLQCASCHTPEPDGVGFAALRMETHCADCHRLEFEPAVSSRQLPHAEPAQVLTSLREFYARIALGETPLDVHTVHGLLQRPAASTPSAQRQQALDWAEQKAQTIAREVFEVRVCATCHEITAVDDADAPWRVAPVRLQRDWLPAARFDHGDHRSQTCTTCHAVVDSSRSEDVAMPGIETCRTCHAGAHPQPGELRSDCSSCHGFHGSGFTHPSLSPVTP
ncbi:MAG TPA: cytochrome c3 family protein [Arenimonas sp.]|nr:cytochrome c3 family protein [Arenimonas sp.]